ncbi:hypothetical protein DO97_06275 [Neosynechococcus sphagnicola sy1]|uniref:Uncharacterized protein n=1 Tax=Neosynechococcus sphagnicola sy1 TaxID=1497020 RepID=A0A098TNN0_9CYAN|nr:hypothetical protein [Neosynechococcus sphagnicola]KGF73940.1 hypothetical protein DO97_06275 [Neosynechococcus sphagnicola sy1]
MTRDLPPLCLSRIRDKQAKNRRSLRIIRAIQGKLGGTLQQLEQQTAAGTKALDRIEKYQTLMELAHANILHLTERLAMVEVRLSHQQAQNHARVEHLEKRIYTLIGLGDGCEVDLR